MSFFTVFSERARKIRAPKSLSYRPLRLYRDNKTKPGPNFGRAASNFAYRGPPRPPLAMATRPFKKVSEKNPEYISKKASTSRKRPAPMAVHEPKRRSSESSIEESRWRSDSVSNENSHPVDSRKNSSNSPDSPKFARLQPTDSFCLSTSRHNSVSSTREEESDLPQTRGRSRAFRGGPPPIFTATGDVVLLRESSGLALELPQKSRTSRWRKSRFSFLPLHSRTESLGKLYQQTTKQKQKPSVASANAQQPRFDSSPRLEPV